MAHLPSNLARPWPLGLAAVVALSLPIACRSEQSRGGLPPPTGKGAPPAPKVPSLSEIARSLPEPPGAATERAGVGSLHPLHEAALGPKETGVITLISVDAGDGVKKGQLLFRLDSIQFELAVAQAKAASSAAKVQFASARLDLERTKALRERNSIAQDALDQAMARMEAAQSAVEQAQAALDLARRRAANMAVYAPIDGVVTERRMNVGETATLMPPSVVLVVQDVEVLELRARLPESALRTVREHSQLSVTFPAIGDTRTVEIKRIAPTIDARTRTIEILADLPNHDRRLKSGMMAEVAYADASPEPPRPSPGERANAATQEGTRPE